MKPADVKKTKKTRSKFEVGDHARILKYKNNFAKGCVPNWSEEVSVIKKVKNTAPWMYVISDLKGEEIVGTFYERALQKANQKEFRVENSIILLIVGLIKKVWYK